MKKISNFMFNDNGAFVEEVSISFEEEEEEWESLHNFIKAWFMVNDVDRLYIDFEEKEVVLNNNFEHLDEDDEAVFINYIIERLGVYPVSTFDFFSYSKVVTCTSCLKVGKRYLRRALKNSLRKAL